ncbi:SDR family NAD(P)-dependent oxidoreductase [Streptomyces sp. UH6]|uniref:SDR family NAD(P)-dependent oxidoreductase n=1 Tax=Streptomyces sp. UH6 TaxID=2748379 RepID=UPI0015D4E48C|nr:SDR family oxidoreductase [Streptomyces sp. UH6]NYV74948.1 SDR family oxidoreductase [Streptomyces sp. UH6]
MHADRPRTGRVAGKVAIVTGGSGDLGAAVVRMLHAHGATVANLDRAAPAENWGTDAVADWTLDITDAAQVASTVRQVTERFGAPDVLVNAAGILGRPAPSHESTEDEFDAVFGVNVKGTWLTTKYVVPSMIERGGGSIVNFSSIHGLTGGGNVPLYHASKGAVRLLTKADAVVYGPHGIRVNSVHPGSMATRMSRSSAERSPLGAEEYYRQLVSGNPIARQGAPEEIAYAVLYLASDESSFTTGTELVVDGGYTAH